MNEIKILDLKRCFYLSIDQTCLILNITKQEFIETCCYYHITEWV